MSALPLSSPRPVASRFKRLLQPVVTPAVFDFWASHLNASWSWERPLARVVARAPASRDAVTLVLAPNRHCGSFLPGQHVNVSAQVQGAQVTRSYSLTGLPRADGHLEITVKAVAGGKLSQYLCHELRLGDVLALSPAFGELRLPADPQGDCLFLAAGSGITPLMALTRELAAAGMPVKLTLAYWARRRDELCFLQELRALAAAQPRFHFHALLTGEAARAADEGEGRLDQALLGTLVDKPEGLQVLACGPGGFVEQARSLLAGTARTFQAEAFSLPHVEHGDTGTVQVRLAKRGVTLQLPRGQSLLEALEAQGVQSPSGCRMGICNTCACAKASGSTRHLPSGALEHEASSALKLCISSAASDLELDL